MRANGDLDSAKSFLRQEKFHKGVGFTHRKQIAGVKLKTLIPQSELCGWTILWSLTVFSVFLEYNLENCYHYLENGNSTCS